MHKLDSPRFVYKTLPLDLQTLREDNLNSLGKQGWMLVATVPHLVFVKRVDPTRAKSSELPSLLTIKQVCEVLNMSRSTVYGLIRAGQICCFRQGRSVRVPRQELERFLERNSP